MGAYYVNDNVRIKATGKMGTVTLTNGHAVKAACSCLVATDL